MIRDSVISFLLRRGIAVTPSTRREDIMRLIRELRPVTAPSPLIRLGPMTDGGYLVPDDLEGIAACFSPGVSCVAGFEKDCAGRGMEVYLADRSIEALPEEDVRFHFLKKFIGAVNNDEFITPDEWVHSCHPDPGSDLLLQMDIEGYEYESILSMTERLIRRFRIIVVEFHSVHLWWSRPFFDLGSRAIRKLLQTHRVVHIHPNNIGSVIVRHGIALPELPEITFLRRDRIREEKRIPGLPHPLDISNTGGPQIVLPPYWYRD